jgi:hypothetical protein
MLREFVISRVFELETPICWVASNSCKLQFSVCNCKRTHFSGHISEQWVSSAICKQLGERAIVHILRCAIRGSFQVGYTILSELEKSA